MDFGEYSLDTAINPLTDKREYFVLNNGKLVATFVDGIEAHNYIAYRLKHDEEMRKVAERVVERYEEALKKLADL